MRLWLIVSFELTFVSRSQKKSASAQCTVHSVQCTVHTACTRQVYSAEPETIKICQDCNSTVTVVDGPVKVIDGPVTVQKNFYSFGLRQQVQRSSRACLYRVRQQKPGAQIFSSNKTFKNRF